MLVIVEYLGTGILRMINPREVVVVHKPDPLVLLEGYQSSVEKDAFRRGFAGPDNHSWKGNARHARKNWMRHPLRIDNTGGARVLINRCYHTL